MPVIFSTVRNFHLAPHYYYYYYTQDVYSITYTDHNQTVAVEVFKCSEDTSVDGHPWTGRAVSIYQLVSLLLLPAIITVFCYQAVIRVLWKSTKSDLTIKIEN